MRPKTRLFLCGAMIMFSALYALVISLNPRVASAIALGYIAVLLTVFFATTVWRRP